MGGKVCNIKIEHIRTVDQLKLKVYQTHPYIPKPFPVSEFGKLDVQLTHCGNELTDPLDINNLIRSDECLYCIIKTRPIPILHQNLSTSPPSTKITAVENYITSPLQQTTPPQLHGFPAQLRLDHQVPSHEVDTTIESRLNSDSESDSDSDTFFECQTENPFTKLVIDRLLGRVDVLTEYLTDLRDDITSLQSH